MLVEAPPNGEVHRDRGDLDWRLERYMPLDAEMFIGDMVGSGPAGLATVEGSENLQRNLPLFAAASPRRARRLRVRFAGDR